MPEEVEARLREKEGGRINKKGELVVTSQETRSRLMNYGDCVAKIKAMMELAKVEPAEWNTNSKTKKKFKEKRLDQKKKNSMKKMNRRGGGFDD
mmetsp:Transcript_24612/g.61471  ORF Transcript_24612/g.61471 Transcript_24612/m.61471 type:complete len:94 (-) Transcript_24612:260-541(-)